MVRTLGSILKKKKCFDVIAEMVNYKNLGTQL